MLVDRDVIRISKNKARGDKNRFQSKIGNKLKNKNKNKRILGNRYKNSNTSLKNKEGISFKILFKRILVCIKFAFVLFGVVFWSCFWIFCYDVIIQCKYFEVKDIKIDGLKNVSETHILKRTQIKKGINILSLNLSLIKKRLLCNPWIHEAEISREFPSTLFIKIKEYTPIAVIDLDKKYLIDIEGKIFKLCDDKDPKDLPFIYGLKYSDIAIGHKIGTIPFNAALEILKIGQKSDNILPNKIISNIFVDSDTGITLHAFNPIKTILLGYNSYVIKYEKLKIIIDYLNKHNIFSVVKTIDLQNLHRIIANPNPFELSVKSNKEV